MRDALIVTFSFVGLAVAVASLATQYSGTIDPYQPTRFAEGGR